MKSRCQNGPRGCVNARQFRRRQSIPTRHMGNRLSLPCRTAHVSFCVRLVFGLLNMHLFRLHNQSLPMPKPGPAWSTRTKLFLVATSDEVQQPPHEQMTVDNAVTKSTMPTLCGIVYLVSCAAKSQENGSQNPCTSTASSNTGCVRVCSSATSVR